MAGEMENEDSSWDCPGLPAPLVLPAGLSAELRAPSSSCTHTRTFPPSSAKVTVEGSRNPPIFCLLETKGERSNLNPEVCSGRQGAPRA